MFGPGADEKIDHVPGVMTSYFDDHFVPWFESLGIAADVEFKCLIPQHFVGAHLWGFVHYERCPSNNMSARAQLAEMGMKLIRADDPLNHLICFKIVKDVTQ